MTWSTLFYLAYTDIGIQDTYSSDSMPDGFKAHQSPFSCLLSTSLLTSVYSPSDEKPHLLKQFSVVVVGVICLQASAMKWGAWYSFWIHHQVILHQSLLLSSIWVAFCTGIWEYGWSPYPVVANGFCSLGGKNRNITFFRAVLSPGCAAHWSMKRKIFLFFAPLWWSSCTRNSSKVVEVIHELEGAWYLVGSFYTFLKQWCLCTCHSPVDVISLYHQHCNLAEVTLCFDFFPSWQESPLYVSVLLDRRL